MKKKVVGKIVSAIDTSKKKITVCLCGKASPHAARKNCIIGPPGTPWWKAFDEAEPGDEVIVHLPTKDLHFVVEKIKPIMAANAA